MYFYKYLHTYFPNRYKLKIRPTQTKKPANLVLVLPILTQPMPEFNEPKYYKDPPSSLISPVSTSPNFLLLS